MTRFVGGQITRHYWGGFTPYLDVLGVEIPATMESTLTVSDDRARLVLDPKRVNERYVAEVVRAEREPAVWCAAVKASRVSLCCAADVSIVRRVGL